MSSALAWPRGRPLRSVPCHRTARPLLKRHQRRYATQEPQEEEKTQEGIYKAVTGIAALGSAETLYLTMSKFLHAPLVCLSSGCDAVVNSVYAEVYGIPVSLLGFFGYGAVGLFAWECLGSRPTRFSKGLLVTSTAVMASCSAVLMYTLLTKLNGEFCSWCYLSAALSFAMCGLSLTILRPEERMTVLMPSSGVSLVVAVALLTVFNGVDGAAVANDIVIDYSDPVVTTASSDETILLAKRLKAAGVRMFGAFWCNHCYDQKQSFGKDAMEFFPYVECYPNGYRKGVKLAQACEDADIKGYPTWMFGSKQVAGEQSVESLEQELADLQKTE